MFKWKLTTLVGSLSPAKTAALDRALAIAVGPRAPASIRPRHARRSRGTRTHDPAVLGDLRVYYAVEDEARKVIVVAVGIKERKKLFLGGKEVGP